LPRKEPNVPATFTVTVHFDAAGQTAAPAVTVRPGEPTWPRRPLGRQLMFAFMGEDDGAEGNVS
jgi:hypothetical protein